MAQEQPKTLEDTRSPRTLEPTAVEPHLFAVLECDRPASGGSRYGLIGVDEVVIGRGEERKAERRVAGGVVRLHVSVPGLWMSSSHARIRRTPSGWTLEDGRSTNGSFVNGRRVESVALRDGDVLELGHALFTLRTALPTPPGTPALCDPGQARLRASVSTLLPAFNFELETLPRVARSGLSALLLGESGTGKELLARAIHEASERPGPFVPLNCSALSPNLIDSQLFGHIKGAFSGALRDEPGFVRSAERGTLLLDEIGDLPPAAQGALLRVLQEQEVVPVGSAQALRVDVRFLAATHRSLDALVDQSVFRGDLLARLDGFRYHLPPLASRREDIGLMIANLFEREQVTNLTFTREAGTALLLHDWPFNVRELLQCLRRAVVLTTSGTIGLEHLALPARGIEQPRARSAPPLSAQDDEVKKRLLLELERHGGNVSEVARAMGKARMQIQRWIRRFGIEHRRG